jgi:hypothetical protein
VNQSSSVNPGGGHPQIVEGVRAYLFLFWNKDLFCLKPVLFTII